MKVSYYCQHVLGIGHFKRSLKICEALAQQTETTLILGGPPVEVNSKDIKIVTLPGLRMDDDFKNLEPCEPGLSLDEVKDYRKARLFRHFREDKPDIFITELYPFGRKAFRFELDPILTAIQTGALEKTLCFCSIRDILVEKVEGREKFENRVVKTLNSSYDGILVHSDPTVVTLDETFPRLNEVSTTLAYTGFVTDKSPESSAIDIRKELRLSPNDKLIVASIGGGNVGSELLRATVKAITLLQRDKSIQLQIFHGPYCDSETIKYLLNQKSTTLRVNRFSNRFAHWLAAADLSISMAGYNTCMNLIASGIPCLVYPFKQNSEQRLRAQKIVEKTPLGILDDNDLVPEQFAKRIDRQLQRQRVTPQIDLDGAENSVRQIQAWYESL